jgi:uncharacterized Zn-finger protein
MVKNENAQSEIGVSCEICSKAFKEKHKLKRHMMVHTGEKPFPCEICGKNFALEYNLKTHIRIHTGEKPFKCEYSDCGKSFTQSGNLKTHMRTNHNNRPASEVFVKKEETFLPFPRVSFDSLLCKHLSEFKL